METFSIPNVSSVNLLNALNHVSIGSFEAGLAVFGTLFATLFIALVVPTPTPIPVAICESVLFDSAKGLNCNCGLKGVKGTLEFRNIRPAVTESGLGSIVVVLRPLFPKVSVEESNA